MGLAVEDTFCYLNTDLELRSIEDLSGLAAAFQAQGVSPLYLTRGEAGLWYATFEVYHRDEEPEPTIAALLVVVESLGKPLRAVWSGCAVREFNIGYDCGSKPWAFNQGLSSQLLGRIAQAGASLRITLYPPVRETSEEQSAASDRPSE